MEAASYIVPIVLGLALAAATGFRVFVPLLVMGLAARQGALPVSDSFTWAASTPALLMLAVAAVAEVAAYYIPGLDHLLDVLATPAAVVAGILVSAAVMTDLPPMLKWSLAIIAGGGAAAATQSATALLRAGSAMTTGGLGNPLVATGELISAIVVSVLSLIAPWLALLLAVLLLMAAYRLLRRRGRSPA